MEELPQILEERGDRLRRLEDLALRALCSLARADGEDAAFQALDESGSDWIRGMILNRAAETALDRQARS